ncbi:MAG: hypothetical protein ACYTAN_04640 [Planctomycetota bacterium]|jgi:hypothetical protein
MVVLLTACEMTTSARRYPRGTRVKPVRIITEEPQGEADALQARLDQQEKAVGAEAGTRAAPAARPAATVAERASEATVKTAEPPREELTDSELSVEALTARLSKKKTRTAREEEAYRRLLGIADTPNRREVGGGRIWELLTEARAAAVREDYEAAQGSASAALALLRQETDPSIDKLYFATNVRNYGDADIIEEPRFKRGQRVMVVTDLSNFACLPVGEEDSAARYKAKLTHRLQIYDTDGALRWQQTFGPFEYQAHAYVATMFVPTKFRLPSSIKAGKYVITAEVIDDLAGRQTQASIEFNVR